MKLFYQSLLVNDTSSYFQSHTRQEAGKKKLLEKICSLHGLSSPLLKKKIQLKEEEEFDDINEDSNNVMSHIDKWWMVESQRLRTLILEECRHTIAEALHQRWNLSRFQRGYALWLNFEKVENDDKVNYMALFDVSKLNQKRFLKAAQGDNIELTRPGTVVEIHPIVKGGRVSVEHILLGTFEPKVWTSATLERKPALLKEKGAIVFYTKGKRTGIPKDGMYKIYPLTSLLSYARQFQATIYLRPDLYPTLTRGSASEIMRPEKDSEDKCRRYALDDTLHTGTGTSQKICEDDSMFLQRVTQNEGGHAEASCESLSGSCLASDGVKKINDVQDPLDNCALVKPTAQMIVDNQFDIPSMNEFQKAASTEFLTSGWGSITLVQGPPGTGKTTMLTATICNFLLTRSKAGDKHPRLMVCAPSNKAVTVLAGRYLEAVNDSCEFQAALVGDREKLLSEDQSQQRFGTIFVYAWLQNTLKDLKAVALSSSLDWMKKQARIEVLRDKIYKNLPTSAMHRHRGVPPLFESILEKVVNPPSNLKSEVEMILDKLQSMLMEMEREIQKRMLNNANVIFCTLSSAGSQLVWQMNSIEALIIDEAGAACEPETYIPIASHRPKHIMIVGDPKQLPPTIMSPIAEAHGLGKSLLERLMNDEKRPYTMLKVQYRMRPEISSFPSATFYEGLIMDGANVSSTIHDTVMYQNLVVKKKPYCFVQVDGVEERQQSGSFQNVKEAEKISALLLDMRNRNHNRSAGFEKDSQWCNASRIRVITFYKAQVELLTATLKLNGLADVLVSTVDSSQGSEADVVVISFVRTGKMNQIGFLSDNRRLNVALTRAKHKLICVGNVENALSNVDSRGTETMRALVKDVTDRQLLTREYSPKVKVIFRNYYWNPHHYRPVRAAVVVNQHQARPRLSQPPRKQQPGKKRKMTNEDNTNGSNRPNKHRKY